MSRKGNLFACIMIAGLLPVLLFQSFTPPRSVHSSFLSQEKLTARIIMDRLIAATEAIKTVTFNLKIQERVQDRYRVSSSSVKLQRSPHKIYMKLSGPELLYVTGWNNNKVLVNPGGFPYVNLNLEVTSSTLHKDQHHTIDDVGFDYLTDIIKDAIQRCGPKFDEFFKYEGDVQWNGVNCCRVQIIDNGYKFTSYVAGQNETVISIARKMKLSEFKIAELNKLGDFGSVKPGKVLVIPTSYARTTELLVDKQTWLPVSTKVFDNQGLFEAYDYLNIKLNPVFAADEFSKTFGAYGF